MPVRTGSSWTNQDSHDDDPQGLTTQNGLGIIGVRSQASGLGFRE